MKKLIIAIFILVVCLIMVSCKSSQHCDAYGATQTTQNEMASL
jgi:hypothetical protein